MILIDEYRWYIRNQWYVLEVENHCLLLPTKTQFSDVMLLSAQHLSNLQRFRGSSTTQVASVAYVHPEERERDTPAAHQSMYFDLHKNIEIYWDILYKIICLNISLLLLLLIYYAQCHHCLPQEMGCFGSWGSKLATNKKTLSKFSIASITIEHGPFVDDLPRTYHVFFWMSIAVFNDQCPTPPLECLWARSTVFGRCSFCICWHSPLCWWQCPNWPHCTQYLKNLHILLTKNGGHIGFLPSYEKWRTTA